MGGTQHNRTIDGTDPTVRADGNERYAHQAFAQAHTTAARRAADLIAPGRSYRWPGGLSRVAAPPAGRERDTEADSKVPFSRSKESPPADRRAPADRRSGAERRNGDRRRTLTLVTDDRRSGEERRQHAQRRASGRRGGQGRRGPGTGAGANPHRLQVLSE